MLVLSRQRDQSIMIGDDIDITVVDIRGDKVRLGIKAPRNVSVHRKEVFEAIKAENEQSAGLDPAQLPGIADKAIDKPTMKLAAKPIRLAVLVSGGGTTLQNLIDLIHANKLTADIGVVIASRSGIAGIERAQKAGLKVVIVDRKQIGDQREFSRQVFAACDDAGAELICLAGWLTLLDLPAKYSGKVMNIHPSLLPSFGGKGLYGSKVHQAVINAGCKVSGCTVHFVDETYDTGPIILQRCVPVQVNDTPEALAARIFEEEKIAYPHAIELFRQNRLKIDGRRVVVE